MNYITVSKSTKECEEHNAANKASIDLGLEYPWQPSADILAREAQHRKWEAELFKRTDDERTIIASLGALPAGVKAEITETRGAGWRLTIRGSGWKRDDSRWLKIGDGTVLGISSAQLEKAKGIIAEMRQIEARRQSVKNEKDAELERYIVFRDANRQFLERLTNNAYLSEFCAPSGFRVNEDGALYYNGGTFTQAQWVQILDLRDTQAEAMKALKASFK
jgi:hypothetical protein